MEMQPAQALWVDKSSHMLVLIITNKQSGSGGDVFALILYGLGHLKRFMHVKIIHNS